MIYIVVEQRQFFQFHDFGYNAAKNLVLTVNVLDMHYCNGCSTIEPFKALIWFQSLPSIISQYFSAEKYLSNFAM